jgi:NADPH:quinone reductase-like Zn-dependent oxidoreductase
MLAAVIADNAVAVARRPNPRPAPDEILVRVASCGVNNADLVQRRGAYAAPSDSPPDIPGLELAGTVVEVGPRVTRFSVGELVMALVGGGAQAEFAVAHERLSVPVPPGMNLVEAGCFMEMFTTAHDALFTQCELALGERLLINGGAGGVGLAALQLAVSVGAAATVTTRSREHDESIRSLGALVVAPEIEHPAGAFDVILELVSAANMPTNLKALARGGRIAVIGTGAGGTSQFDFRQLMFKRARVLGSTLRARPLEERAKAVQLVASHVRPLAAAGKVSVPIFRTFPLNDVSRAYAQFATPGKYGKIALIPG